MYCVNTDEILCRFLPTFRKNKNQKIMLAGTAIERVRAC